MDEYDIIDIEKEEYIQINKIDENINEGEFGYFYLSELVKQLWTSFHKNYNNLENQLRLDFHRMNIYYNNYRYNDFNEFLKIDVEILLLCTQATFSIPYKIVSGIFNNENIVTTSGQYIEISIKKIDNKYEIFFICDFAIKNIETSEKINNVRTTIYTLINNDYKDNTCLFNWHQFQ